VGNTFRFLEGVTTADFAFEAFGSSAAELFRNAGLALESVIVDLSSVKGSKQRKLRIKAKDLEGLLFDFLSELTYLQSAEGLVFSNFEIAIRGDSSLVLEAQCFGEKIDPRRHRLGTEVKGVTLHEFKVEKLAKGWRAQVVLDV